MTDGQGNETGHDLPATIGSPAQRALTLAGYTRLEHLTNATQREISQLHGVGPKALRLLVVALAERGLGFRTEIES